MTSHVVLKLYIAGQTPRAESAIFHLRRICETALHNQAEIIVVDVLERPDLAEAERILATPTLVREVPPPRRRVIGDLTDIHKVLTGLGLRP